MPVGGRAHYTQIMDRRTIAAALMLLLGGSAYAGELPPSPAYGQAVDLAAGRPPPAAAYDGTAARASVQGEVGGALTTGGLTVPAVTPPPSRGILAPRPVPPAPVGPSEHEPFFSRHALTFGGAGAAAGALAGWLLGGPLGALIGAAAGFAIGFALSKLLRH